MNRFTISFVATNYERTLNEFWFRFQTVHGMPAYKTDVANLKKLYIDLVTMHNLLTMFYVPHSRLPTNVVISKL